MISPGRANVYRCRASRVLWEVAHGSQTPGLIAYRLKATRSSVRQVLYRLRAQGLVELGLAGWRLAPPVNPQKPTEK